MRLNSYQPRFPSPANNSVIKGFAKIVGKDRNDVDAKRCHCRLPFSDADYICPDWMNSRGPAHPANRQLAIGNLKFQKPFRRINSNQFLILINLDDDVRRNRHQAVATGLLDNHKHFNAAGSQNLFDVADLFSVNGRDATANQLPVVERIAWKFYAIFDWYG